MKTIWRISVLFTGLALLVFAVERTGSGRVVRELHAMSGALVVILALSLIRLRLQTNPGRSRSARTAWIQTQASLCFCGSPRKESDI